jgi:cytochrome b involved in lipid metabolism
MEENHKEKMKLQLAKDISQLNWDIDYHEKKLAESKFKIQIAEYALKQLISDEYASE